VNANGAKRSPRFWKRALECIKSELFAKMSDTDEILVKVCEFGQPGNDVTLTFNQRNGFRLEPISFKFKGIDPGMR
jgi:hypothetical protein